MPLLPQQIVVFWPIFPIEERSRQKKSGGRTNRGNGPPSAAFGRVLPTLLPSSPRVDHEMKALPDPSTARDVDDLVILVHGTYAAREADAGDLWWQQDSGTWRELPQASPVRRAIGRCRRDVSLVRGEQRAVSDQGRSRPAGVPAGTRVEPDAAIIWWVTATAVP